MPDRTVVSRVRRQRAARVMENWQEVKVWVPTEADARDIRNLAANRRAKAEALHGLSQEVPKVNIETEMRIARAIAEHGSAAYDTPSGAVMTLMTELTDEGDLESFSRAFVIFARAKPANARFLAAKVPAKIKDFLIKHRGIPEPALMKWLAGNPEWEDRLKAAVRDPARFENAVETMVHAIQQGAR